MNPTSDQLWIIFVLFSARNFNVEAAEKMLRAVSRINCLYITESFLLLKLKYKLLYFWVHDYTVKYSMANHLKILENIWTVCGDSASTPRFSKDLFLLCLSLAIILHFTLLSKDMVNMTIVQCIVELSSELTAQLTVI